MFALDDNKSRHEINLLHAHMKKGTNERGEKFIHIEQKENHE